MKTYKNLYPSLCSLENLRLAFEKAKKRKSYMPYVKEFEKDLVKELSKLSQELESFTYQPKPLKRFIIKDPKTRVIHASAFRDRVVHHALINILEPIYEKVFIFDSYASRKGKGTLAAMQRFDFFIRKISCNGRLVKNAWDNNQIRGYVLKADIRKYFGAVDQNKLVEIIQQKITDRKIIWLVKQILDNFQTDAKGKGMPLGNYTSQFFANVYLHELDMFVKHELKAKYYLRYVDDFVLFSENQEELMQWKAKINLFLRKSLLLELHPEKSRIIPLRNGLTFLGYKMFYHYKRLKKSNLKKFERNFADKTALYQNGFIVYEKLLLSFSGWLGYAVWADTYSLRRNILNELKSIEK